MDDRHRAYASGLSREERLLIVLRDEIYDKNWDGIVQDLEARSAKKPYVIKLATRIEDDLNRIASLRKYEEDHDVDLAKFLPRFD